VYECSVFLLIDLYPFVNFVKLLSHLKVPSVIVALLSAWVWVSTAACAWYEAWRGSYAKFLCANGSAGSAGSATWRSTGRSWSAIPAASPTYAAAG